MAQRSIRVLVVDDSMLIRRIICDMIGECSDLEVVGTAADGRKAIEKVAALRPDVVTLDIQMPHMDGLTTLDHLLQQHPVPVVMVSSLTQLGATITLDALDRGAVDYVAKPENVSQVQSALGEELTRKIRSVAGIDVRRILRIRKDRRVRRKEQARQGPPPPKPVSAEGIGGLADQCIAIGISTGGPPALSRLFESLQPPLPPIVVVQHMPPQFTRPLSWRLDTISRLSIKEAADGDVLRPNQVLVAPGGLHLELRRQGSLVKTRIQDGPPVSGHKPSVDVMMTSAAKAFRGRCLGVIMTGMGRDGSDGCGAIRAAGGYVLGQDEASSDVYGMNKVAFAEGHVDRQVHLDELATAILRQARRAGSPAGAAP